MTIGQLAKRAGVNLQTIRFYERTGLLATPERALSGYRLYKLDDLQRVAFIKRAKDLGFSLSEIADLLALETNPHATCADVKHRAMGKISTIQQRLNDLQTMKRALSRLVASCNGNAPIKHCPIFECFGTSNPKEESR